MKKKPDPEQTSKGILENNVCNICSNCFFQVNLVKNCTLFHLNLAPRFYQSVFLNKYERKVQYFKPSDYEVVYSSCVQLND